MPSANRVPPNAPEVLILAGSFTGQKARVMRDGGSFASLSLPGMILNLTSDFYAAIPSPGNAQEPGACGRRASTLAGKEATEATNSRAS